MQTFTLNKGKQTDRHKYQLMPFELSLVWAVSGDQISPAFWGLSQF